MLLVRRQDQNSEYKRIGVGLIESLGSFESQRMDGEQLEQSRTRRPRTFDRMNAVRRAYWDAHVDQLDALEPTVINLV